MLSQSVVAGPDKGRWVEQSRAGAIVDPTSRSSQSNVDESSGSLAAVDRLEAQTSWSKAQSRQ